MAYGDTRLGDILPYIQQLEQVLLSFEINNLSEFFDKIEELLKSSGFWDAEVAANLAIARDELSKNPILWDEGIDTVVTFFNDIAAKYPPNTFLRDIPELAVDGVPGGGDESYEVVEGPGGIDIALFHSLFSDVSVSYDASTGVVSVSGAGYSYVLPDVDRLQFEDGFLAFDFDGAAGAGYRIYQAAFAREPDLGGLSYWIKALDGGADLLQVAQGFLGSPEFISAYGADLTAEAYVDLLYENILGREGEQDGIDYWVSALNDGLSFAHALAQFSESNENVVGTQSAISGGIWFVDWV